MLLYFFLIICAYLLGSISAAVIVCRFMGLADPRTEGSGNPGATNVLRFGGKTAAIVTLLLDVLKGVLAVLLAKAVTDSNTVLAGATLAVFLGHLYPIFFRFQGGKGVATAFGGLVTLAWPVGLSALITWLITAILFRYSSVAALVAAFLTPIYTFWFTHTAEYVIMTILLSSLLIWRHRSNIVNLKQGKEDKIHFSKQKSE